jgi:hypothetical protein
MKQIRLNLGPTAALVGLCVAIALPACGANDDEETHGPAGGKNGATGGARATGGRDATGGSTSSGAPGGADGEPPLGGAGGETGAPIAESVYALTAQVFGETENTSYVLLTDTLDESAELSLGDAVVELPGRALGTGPEGAGVLFVASDQAPTVTRYALDDGGGLTEDGMVSFLGKGITKFGEYGGQFQYVAGDKAYWFDGPTAQIVVWDPSAMTVGATISLGELAHEGEVLSFTAAPVRKGSKLYSFAAWRRELEIVSRLAVVIVDTEQDDVQIVEDTRCGYVRDGVLDDDGLLYLATEAFGSAGAYLNPSNPEPCLLRLDTSTASLDPDFRVSLAELSGAPAAGSLVRGPGNQPFLRVIDEAAIPEEVTNPRALASLPVWGWAKLTLGDEPSLEAVDAALAGGSVLPFQLGERAFAPVFVAGEETAFVELTAEGPAAAAAAAVPGLVFSAVKLR